jgi:hypothetical protein
MDWRCAQVVPALQAQSPEFKPVLPPPQKKEKNEKRKASPVPGAGLVVYCLACMRSWVDPPAQEKKKKGILQESDISA